jgi:hypothetical protein
MIYQILTIINIMGIVFTIVKMLFLLKDYWIVPKMALYIVWSVISLTMLLVLQFYRIIDNESWALGLAPILLWGKMLYWTWAQKYSSLKK